MSEPPQDTPKPDSGWQPPDRQPGEAPASPERPPPYQGSYGGPPPQAAPAAGLGHPVAPPPQAPPVPGYGPPGYHQPGQHQPGQYGPGQHGPGQHGPQDAVAGRGARLGAGIIDSVILGIVAMPAVLFSIRWDRFQDMVRSGEPITDPLDLYNIPRLLTGYAIAFLLGFVYFAVLHVRWGQTLGKKAFGIRLVRASDHSAVSWGQALGRQALVYAISASTAALNLLVAGGGLLGLLGLLDNAWILWDERRQALHDKAAGTVVVKATPWTPNPYAREQTRS